MKRFRRLRAAALFACLALAVISAAQPAAGARLLGPTGDILERFGADPRTLQDAGGKSLWFASGSWTWEPGGTTFSLTGNGAANLVRTGGSHYAGTLNLRLKLGAEQSRARLLFAFDPATGAHRWVEVAAGSPGRITLGQTGSIGGSEPGVIQVWRVTVAPRVWQKLTLLISGNKSATVSLGDKSLFTAAVAPLAPGLIGFAAAEGPVSFDEFSFTANPDGEPCIECHAGQADQPQAANVYIWWDGRRWDALTGGSPSAQQGGHGDPGGKAALGCTGVNGCHDMRQPRPGDHRNGTREGRRRPTLNSFHLRSEAVVAAPRNSWDTQVVFDDNFCWLLCHPAAGVKDHRHVQETDVSPAYHAVQLGTKGTRADGTTLAVPVDSDVTTRARTTRPDFAPCLSCHDSHGTGAPNLGQRSNYMLRTEWAGELCRICHI